ncbi:MAG: hypothetical protein ACE5IY_04960, partial [bacterium]
WHISDLQGGVDFEVTLSEKAVLTAGLSHSKLQGETRWSPSVGIGFYGEGTTFGQRIDLVLKGTTSSYDAEVSESEFLSSRSLTENGKKTYGNLAVIYSLNTRRPDFPVNLFANAAIGGQTLYRHEDFSAMQLYISLSGGLFKTIGKNARLVIGGRITNFEDEGKSDDLVVPDAFVQLDFILN